MRALPEAFPNREERAKAIFFGSGAAWVRGCTSIYSETPGWNGEV
jgi:hypothetical protein